MHVNFNRSYLKYYFPTIEFDWEGEKIVMDTYLLIYVNT